MIHPVNKAERIKLSEKKDKTTKIPADKAGRRKRLEVREKEAEDELSLAIANYKG